MLLLPFGLFDDGSFLLQRLLMYESWVDVGGTVIHLHALSDDSLIVSHHRNVFILHDSIILLRICQLSSCLIMAFLQHGAHVYLLHQIIFKLLLLCCNVSSSNAYYDLVLDQHILILNDTAHDR